jgi:hypothetical protein
MHLTLDDGRPAHLTRVHAARTSLPEADQARPGVTTSWKTGPHQLTYRQVEHTFRLITAALVRTSLTAPRRRPCRPPATSWCVPTPAPLTRPAQAKRLRGDTGDLRIEIERPEMITLKPGPITDVAACRRGPPPAREMPKPPRPAELAHRHPILKPNLCTRCQRRPPLNAAAVNELQLKPATRKLRRHGGGLQNRQHTQDHPEPGKLRWQDTPNEQDSVTKGRSTVTGQDLRPLNRPRCRGALSCVG